MHPDLEKLASLLEEYDACNDDEVLRGVSKDKIIDPADVPEEVTQRFKTFMDLRKRCAELREPPEELEPALNDPRSHLSAVDFISSLVEDPETARSYFGRLFYESEEEFNRLLDLYDDPEVRKRILTSVAEFRYFKDFTSKEFVNIADEDYQALKQETPELLEACGASSCAITLCLLRRQYPDFDRVSAMDQIFRQLLKKQRWTNAAHLLLEIKQFPLDSLDERTRQMLAIELCRTTSNSIRCIHPLEQFEHGELHEYDIRYSRQIRKKLYKLLKGDKCIAQSPEDSQ